ncbi:MAG TPA: gamma-glutamyl-gamma-aminobutyrate hydrolase family protein [Acidimicrobiales bacterium]|nr:gamma-glutamyl-gamma-aminobutyrate hydrolase family protein [Acidimicrobiales bacterium]
MTRPRIGMAIGREHVDGRRFDAVPHEYVAAVLAAGGLPRPIPPLPALIAHEALDDVDGLLLTGGGDIDPACYGATRRPETGDADAERDASELALVAAALDRRTPVLGICRGAQLLNVALGGTLHQHLDDRSIDHQDRRRRHEVVHEVTLDPRSVVAGLCGSTRIEVNSVHHQGMDRLGATLSVMGRSDEGVVEVLESDRHPLLAVQWHPECLPGLPVNRALFSWLVDRAREIGGPATGAATTGQSSRSSS